MPTPTFQRITVDEFARLLRAFQFTRKINAVHMHHTWQPRRRDFEGHETIVSMWRYHTQTNGWADIAQHITIDPEGKIWLGRNWNLPPASAKGHNGNSEAGPFMFEMVGDFDAGPGHDPFDGEQRETAIKVIALVQRQFDLEPGTLRFHSMMSTKTCPGSALGYKDVLDRVASARAGLEEARDAGAEATRSPFWESEDRAIRQAVRGLLRITENPGEDADAEPPCRGGHLHGDGPDLVRDAAGIRQQPRDSGLDPATLAQLRPHLVNLRAGKFSSEGEATSTPQDVDAIFEQHLPQWLEEQPAGKARIVFFAHGGLVSEGSGLRIVHKHLQWWLDNHVYPVYFVWETGFFETVGQLLERAGQGTRAVTRDLADFTTDPLIEVVARALQGPRIWGGMKWSAERAADAGGADAQIGGSRYVAQKLKAFCDQHGQRVDLHAIGHSAGSIFHAWFLPLARDLGVPAFESLQLLAPAIRVDTFKARMLAHLQNGSLAARTTIFTMQRDYERRDNCGGLYRKSLLYLIFNALEDRPRTPILGLEESLRGDPDLKALFGLAGAASGRGEVIWSVTGSDTGRSASRSTAHGDFDDDPPTMNSVLRRVLGKQDADPIVDYQPPREGQRGWSQEVDWPYGMPAPAAAAPSGGAQWEWAGAGLSSRPPVPPAAWQPSSPPAVAGGGSVGGRRRALCIGVDAYPNPLHRLQGCVNDARTWAGVLASLGFEIGLLLDHQATRASIDGELQRLLSGSRPGDVLVVQYAGHGTNVADLDGDETDGRDEAICPVDFESGALYIDDDLARAFALLPEGVGLTVFMDCCHSGTNTRFAVGLEPGTLAPPAGSRARLVRPTPDLEAAHARFRRQNPALARALVPGGNGGAERMRHVKFAACLDHEVALESGGNGEFTRRATRVLGRGIPGVSNASFLQAVLSEFGSPSNQTPMLDCAGPARGAALLQPLAGGRAVQGAPMAASRDDALVQAIGVLGQAVQALSPRP